MLMVINIEIQLLFRTCSPGAETLGNKTIQNFCRHLEGSERDEEEDRAGDTQARRLLRYLWVVETKQVERLHIENASDKFLPHHAKLAQRRPSLLHLQNSSLLARNETLWI
jgi:hypothetical protein